MTRASLVHCPIIILICAQFLGGCKSLYDLRGYSKSPSKGKLAGVDWAYGYGYTDPEAKLADGQELMIVLTTSKPKHACPDTSDTLPDPREVAIAVDGKLGEMIIGAKSDRLETEEDMFTYKKSVRQASVAFHDPSKKTPYEFAKSGKVKITKKSADSIEGAIVAKIDKDNFVNGQFKVKVCKYGQLN